MNVMGISPGWLRLFIELADAKNFQKGDSFLDIGASELFCADDPNSINKFISHFGGKVYPADELAIVANRQYARDAFVRAGFRYSAIDYANFPDIIRLDLNVDSLPTTERGRYKFVSNAGTSEHILNQYNVFKVIHEATAPGGLMYHGVPSFGDFEHGVLNYNPKFFWSLATDNDYEIVKYDGWADSVAAPLREDFVEKLHFTNIPVTQKVWLQAVFRKIHDRPFRGLNDPAFNAAWSDPKGIDQAANHPSISHRQEENRLDRRVSKVVASLVKSMSRFRV
jgi:hypothetical protein